MSELANFTLQVPDCGTADTCAYAALGMRNHCRTLEKPFELDVWGVKVSERNKRPLDARRDCIIDCPGCIRRLGLLDENEIASWTTNQLGE